MSDSTPPDEPRMPLRPGPDGRPIVEVFLSWASADLSVAGDLWKHLGTALAISPTYHFTLWSFDEELRAGEDWDNRIRDALQRASLAVFAISPDFLNSPYIANVELPPFVGGTAVPGRRAVPILLEPLPQNANLRGLAPQQIFRHPKVGAKRSAFSQAGANKRRWVNALADEIHAIVKRYGDVTP